MFKTIDKCRCCDNNQMMQYLDLGNQPLANAYHRGEDLPVFPLQVMLCTKCFHSQLSVVVEPSTMFKNYLYVSGTTSTYRKHCQELAKDARSRSCKVRPMVLDIACNDGTLLECFRNEGCDVMGVDPAENLRQFTREKGIPVRVDYWGSGVRLEHKYDIINGSNVFAHVDNIDGFIQDALVALENDGTIILEFPYCHELISKYEFDTIYHEHLSYFLVSPFRHFVERFHLGIMDVIQTPIHGGSIRFFLKKGITHCDKVGFLEERERTAELFNVATYKMFSREVDNNKAAIRELLATLQGPVIGYGAAAKGNTMLNYYQLQEDIEYIVDDNAMKWGLLTPGTNIGIRSPDVLSQDSREFNVLLLAWNFADEIKARVKKLRPWSNDKYVYCVPRAYVE